VSPRLRRRGAGGRRSRPRLATALISALLTGVSLGQTAASAPASVGVGSGAREVKLSVDAAGDALVSWREDGQAQSVLLSAGGSLSHAMLLPGPDRSKPAALTGLADAAALRRTPDGRLWALQQVQLGAGAPVELELARWRGRPTTLTLSTGGTRLRGTVSFQGSPVSGFSPTPAGKRLRIYVYLDCFGCPGKPGWSPMLAVAPLANGSFTVYLRQSWAGSRYRATVAGPNLGATLAPAAVTVLDVG
jgi:hypothetical protein